MGVNRVLLGNTRGPQGPQGVQGPRGIQGIKGDDGRNGIGVAEGGIDGQVLVKDGSFEYQTRWADVLLKDEVNNRLSTISRSITTLSDNIAKESARIDAIKAIKQTMLPTGDLNWSSNKCRQYISGVKSTDTPLIGLNLASTLNVQDKQAIKEEWGKVIDAQSGDGYIDFYCSEAPTRAIPLIIKVL